MSFIDTLKAESVNMDPDEFESYTSGKKVPLGNYFWQSHNSVNPSSRILWKKN